MVANCDHFVAHSPLGSWLLQAGFSRKKILTVCCTGLRPAQIEGNTFFLCVFLLMFREEIHILMGRMNSSKSPSSVWVDIIQYINKNEWIPSPHWSWNAHHLLPSGMRTLGSLVLVLRPGCSPMAPQVLLLDLDWKHITGVSGLADYNWHTAHFCKPAFLMMHLFPVVCMSGKL